MADIIIADIKMTLPDETYYVMQSRSCEGRYKRDSLSETESALIKDGWLKSGWIHRADMVKVDWWQKGGDGGLAVWDNDVLPYKHLK